MSDFPYVTDDAKGEDWTLMLGDSCERLAEIPDDSIDLSIYSPPFASLYTYSPSERDLGNSATREEFLEHYRFIVDHLLRITKPGRIACVHVQQLTMNKQQYGYMGITDFRGQVIQCHVDAGWIFHGETTIDKDPQAAAVRTHSAGLLFVQLYRDSAVSRPGLADYLLIFRKKGENAVPIIPDIDRETWIKWAHPVWYDIRESDTLNVTVAREEADERHIAPLQLGLIKRCVRLWSNPGELVCSPFAGIGSEGYVAVEHGRRYIGCELKPSYWQTAVNNLRAAEAKKLQGDLFADA